MSQKTVVVLGASHKEERYSNKAIKMLLEYKHKVLAINPRKCEIYGLITIANLDCIDEPIDTVTIYISPKQSVSLGEDIIRIKPKRVIFNPGTEIESLEETIRVSGIEVLRACTLVMLRTNQF